MNIYLFFYFYYYFDQIDIEYVPAPVPNDPEFAAIFSKFYASANASNGGSSEFDMDSLYPVSIGIHDEVDQMDMSDTENEGVRVGLGHDSEHDSDHSSDAEEGGHTEGKLSRKKMKKLQRLSVAELKQLVKRPEVVEVSFSFFLFFSRLLFSF